MIQAQFKPHFDRKLSPRVNAAARKRTQRGIVAMSKYIYRVARNSIRYRKNKKLASPAERPPYTHVKSGGLKNIIRTVNNKKSVIVGFLASRFAWGGIKKHEFGGTFPNTSGLANAARLNARLRVGGSGPVRYGRLKRKRIPKNVPKNIKTVYKNLVWGKLRSDAQVERSRDIIEAISKRHPQFSLNAKSTARYPRRPTFNLFLQRHKTKLNDIFNNSVRVK